MIIFDIFVSIGGGLALIGGLICPVWHMVFPWSGAMIVKSRVEIAFLFNTILLGVYIFAMLSVETF